MTYDLNDAWNAGILLVNCHFYGKELIKKYTGSVLCQICVKSKECAWACISKIKKTCSKVTNTEQEPHFSLYKVTGDALKVELILSQRMNLQGS